MTPPSPKTSLHVGAQLDRAPGPKYVSTLAFAELALRPPLPRPATLAQIRRGLPAGFVIALRAPKDSVASSLGALRMTPELEEGVKWLIAAADAAAAQAVIIPTPAELTPGGRSRELLREYVARLPRVPDRHYVWMPSGLWEDQESYEVAAELGLVRGFDPLEADRPPGGIAYGTLRALGHRTGFSPAVLADALDELLSPETEVAFLSVDAERGFDVAKRAKQVALERFGAPGAPDAGEDDAADDGEDEDDLDDDGDWDDEEDDDSEPSGEGRS